MQLCTNPDAMPIEDASVEWLEDLSPTFRLRGKKSTTASLIPSTVSVRAVSVTASSVQGAPLRVRSEAGKRAPREGRRGASSINESPESWIARAPRRAHKPHDACPIDISPVAVFLASDAAALVTGAEYEVTAGDSAKDIEDRYFGGSANIRPSGHKGPIGMSSNVIMPARPKGKSSSSLCASPGSVTFIRKTAPDPSLFANH